MIGESGETIAVRARDYLNPVTNLPKLAGKTYPIESEQLTRKGRPMKTRFIKAITASAKQDDVKLPWERGVTRAQMIARRKAAQTRKAA